MHGALLERGSCPALNTILFLYSPGKMCAFSCIYFLAKKTSDSSLSRRETWDSDLLTPRY